MVILFRNTMLINGMLFSIESVHGLKDKHIDQLASCDKYLLRKAFDALSTTATESFYLETGILPVKYAIIARRLMYFWTILNKPDSELVKQVYSAQKIAPYKNDWILQIKDDLDMCNIELTETEIAKMKKEKFKVLVKNSVRELAKEHLLNIKNSHSKSRSLNENFVMQTYLQSKMLSLHEKQLLFQLRTYSYNCKANFKNKYKENLLCNFCNMEDNQEHLINCSIVNKDKSLEYRYIFGSIEEQVKIIKHLKEVDTKRKLFDENPSLLRSHSAL